MKTITLDFETYYDNDYSLRRMTPVEYILHPRFEVIGCAVVDDELGDPVFMTEQQLRDYLKGIPSRTAVVTHNALFDCCILSWRFNYVPALMIDTLGMARAMLAHELKSLALSKVAAHLELGVKGDTVLKVAGMGLEAIKQAGLLDEYAQYSINDAVLTREVFRALMTRGFPPSELLVLDTVLRCAVKPKFQLDQTKLAEHLHAVKQAKVTLLERAGFSNTDELMSNEKFANALRTCGVEPPMKTSIRTGQETYAFAKTDAAFTDLLDHENPEVQALCAARMGIKSTLEETRTQRLIDISNLTWHGPRQRLMPIPLRYSGAHTHRLSGDWKLNMQNLPSRGNNKIRSALAAPEDHIVLAVDASQIEARINAWISNEEHLVQAFAEGRDIYSEFASMVFGYPVSKANKRERTLGKISILGLGYGMGALKFKDTVRIQSGGDIVIDDNESQRIVNLYRSTYSNIAQVWRTLTDMIPRMTRSDCNKVWGPITFLHEKIRLPNGLHLHYRNLRNEGGRWKFDYGAETKDLYGGKLLENIVQALARICTMDAAVKNRTNFSRLADDLDLAMQVHDELVYVAPVELESVMRATLLENMASRPQWAPDLPLASECESGPNYGEAK